MESKNTEIWNEVSLHPVVAEMMRQGWHRGQIHVYRNPDCSLGFVLVRLNNPQTGEKWLRPFKHRNGEWVPGKPQGFNRLYRLPKLLRKAAAPVWFVEGESCVEAIESLGALATTSGASSSDSKVDFSPIAGREVRIWPDNDSAGRDFGSRVASALVSLGCDVAVVDIDALGLPEKGDVVDWLKQDPSRETAALGEVPLMPFKAVSSPEVQSKRRRVVGGRRPLEPTEEGSRVTVRVGSVTYEYRSNDGVTRSEGQSNDAKPAESRKICGPLRVVAFVRTPNSSSWSRMLAWTDKDGKAHKHVVPESDFLERTPCFLRTLVSRGLWIAPTARTHSEIREYVLASNHVERATLAMGQGWCDDVFVVGELGVADSASGEAVVCEASMPRDWMRVSGDVDAWVEQVSKPCQAHSRLVLGICAAFAGPLLDIVGEPPGGVHFVGPTSTGKTTALNVCASVFGPPEIMRRTWRATSNALEAVASLHNDSVLPLDELSEIDGKELKNAVYMLGNGAGKSRSMAEGGLRESEKWRVTVVSTGELTIEQHIVEAGGRVQGGLGVRIVDVAHPESGLGIFDVTGESGSPAEMAETLGAATASAHGAVGLRWVTHLSTARVDDPEGLVQRLQGRLSQIRSKFDATRLDAQQRRVARRFAVFALAGELATEQGLTGWEAGVASAAAQTCFASWVKHYGSETEQLTRAVLSRLEETVVRHGASRFEPYDGQRQGPVAMNRIGWVRELGDGTQEYLLPRTSFEKHIAGASGVKFAEKVLEDAGLYVRHPNGGPTHVVQPRGLKQVRAYVLRPFSSRDGEESRPVLRDTEEARTG